MYELTRLTSNSLRDIHDWIKIWARDRFEVITCGTDTAKKISGLWKIDIPVSVIYEKK